MAVNNVFYKKVILMQIPFATCFFTNSIKQLGLFNT